MSITPHKLPYRDKMRNANTPWAPQWCYPSILRKLPTATIHPNNTRIYRKMALTRVCIHATKNILEWYSLHTLCRSDSKSTGRFKVCFVLNATYVYVWVQMGGLTSSPIVPGVSFRYAYLHASYSRWILLIQTEPSPKNEPQNTA